MANGVLLKILIISSFFPPQNSIASLRPYSWAKYWSLAGHNVTVLTVSKPNRDEDSPMSFDGFEVVELPIPFFSGLQKKVVREIVPPQSARSNTYARTLKSKAWQWCASRFGAIQKKYGCFSGCRMPDWRDLWVPSALKFARSERWDLVVSTAGPYSVHYVAYRLRSCGLANKWIADWRDLWTDNHIYPGLPFFRSAEAFLERRWSSCADIITTVSEPLAELLRHKYSSKVRVVCNGFDQDEYKYLPSERVFSSDGIFRIVYTGSIYEKKQNPVPLFEAIANIYSANPHIINSLRVVLVGHNANIKNLADSIGVGDFVEYQGFVTRPVALRMQRDADCLLFLDFDPSQFRGVLTGKIFEYLVAGPPIISIGFGLDPVVNNVILDAQRGFILGSDVAKIQDCLLSMMERRGKHRTMNNCIFDMQKYSRASMAERMLEFVNE